MLRVKTKCTNEKHVVRAKHYVVGGYHGDRPMFSTHSLVELFSLKKHLFPTYIYIPSFSPRNLTGKNKVPIFEACKAKQRNAHHLISFKTLKMKYDISEAVLSHNCFLDLSFFLGG